MNSYNGAKLYYLDHSLVVICAMNHNTGVQFKFNTILAVHRSTHGFE